MKDKELWNKVRKNAESQDGQFRPSKKKKREIEKFYPELYGPEIGGGFTSTPGSHLIPDLLTSPHVIVDIYDWPDESGLIETYGVDLAFLHKLRDKNLVTIAPNLRVDRFKKASWLHATLADKRTIFKSHRTPHYFSEHFPDMGKNRVELEKRLVAQFRKYSAPEIGKLFELARSTFPATKLPNQKHEDIAEWLSWQIIRVAGAAPSLASGKCVDSIRRDPGKTFRKIARTKFLAVTPISGALGGVQRVTSTQLLSIFPRDVAKKLIKDEEWARINAIDEFLADVELKVATAALSNVDYWTGLNADSYRKDKLLDILSNAAERKERLVVESKLRSRIGRLDKGVSKDEILDYVRRDEKTFDRIAKWGEFCILGGVAVFTFLAKMRVYGAVGATIESAKAAGAGLLGCALVKEISSNALEFSLPRLHVVNYVKRRKSGSE